MRKVTVAAVVVNDRAQYGPAQNRTTTTKDPNIAINNITIHICHHHCHQQIFSHRFQKGSAKSAKAELFSWIPRWSVRWRTLSSSSNVWHSHEARAKISQRINVQEEGIFCEEWWMANLLRTRHGHVAKAPLFINACIISRGVKMGKEIFFASN